MDISSNDRSAMMPNYSFPDLVPEKASGSRLWDENGKEYIDFGGGIAVTSLGHCHPVLMKSMEEQSKKLWHVSNYLLSKPAKELGQKITGKYQSSDYGRLSIITNFKLKLINKFFQIKKTL